MKRLSRLLLGLCLALLMSGVAAAAPGASLTHTGQGFTTVVTDLEGNTRTLDGILEVSDDTQLASCQVRYGERVLLDTQFHPLPTGDSLLSLEAVPHGGYYAITFPLSEEDNTHAFLTGLTLENMGEVQTQLVEATLEGTVFALEDLSFIDAEKTQLPDDGDNELCWAATTACMLHYTGWGQQAGFASEDALLDRFVEAFDDMPGHTLYGLEWFFNGLNQPQGTEEHPALEGWPQIKEGYGDFTGHLPQYCGSALIRYWDVSQSPADLTQMLERLEQGYGAGLSLGWVDENGQRNGGHSVTCWGYLWDEDLPAANKGRYLALITSDSDSDQLADPDRTHAPNKLHVLNMEPFDAPGYDCWRFPNYGGGVLEGFTLLSPWEDTLPTENEGSRSLFQDYDLLLENCCIASDPYDTAHSTRLFTTDDTIYITPTLNNNSYRHTAQDATETISVQLTVSPKEGGEPVFDQSLESSVSVPILDVLSMEWPLKFSVSPLEPGEYEATLTLNPDHTIPEAYYINNTGTFSFTVAEGQDASQVSFSADMEGDVRYDLGSPRRASADFTLDFPGLDAFLDDLETDELTLKLYALCTEQGSPLDGWTLLGTCHTLSELESYCSQTQTLFGDSIRFRLTVSGQDIPDYNFYAAPIPLPYLYQVLTLDESNTGSFTPLDRGAHALSQGERFAFRVEDRSVNMDIPASIPCTLYLTATPTQGGEAVTLWAQSTTLDNGCTPLIELSAWDADILLSGTYRIAARLDSPYSTYELDLGTLSVREQPSAHVTTDQDIQDPYDGMISLREAVDYLEELEPGAAVTFPSSSWVYLNSPIEIDREVILQGDYPVCYSHTVSCLFHITSAGSLTGDRLAFIGNGSDLPVIWNEGGSISLSRSRMLYSGGIFSQGGTVVLRDCNFKGNLPAAGGALQLTDGASLSALNCNFFNQTNSPALRLDSGSSALLLYSTFTGNYAGVIALEDGSSTRLFGCIAVDNGEEPFTGDVELTGCYTGPADRMFTDIDEEGAVPWYYYQSQELTGYQTPVTSLANRGILLKNTDGCLTWSSDGSTWTATGLVSPFSDADYARDSLGRPHGPLYGSLTYIAPDTGNSDSSDSSGGSGISQYLVQVLTADHGTVRVSPGYAQAGETVTVTAAAEEGYALSTLTVTGSDGQTIPLKRQDNGTYTFPMPQGRVVVQATFIQLSGTLLPCSLSEDCPLSQFTDLSMDAWYHDAIHYCLDKGLMSGMAADRFQPDGTVTRGQLVTILWQLAGKPVVNYAMPFTDVAADAYYAEAIRWAAGEGLAAGSGSGLFAPDAPITREQLASILYRYVQKGGGGFTGAWAFPLPFADAKDVHDYAYEALCWMTMNGIVSGCGDNLLLPQGQATRAQAAQMIRNFAQLER